MNRLILSVHNIVLQRLSCVQSQIQEVSGARINFKDEVAQEGPERVVVIRGTHSSAQQAEIMIRKIIADQPPIVSEIIYVPQKALGRIIGTACNTFCCF